MNKQKITQQNINNFDFLTQKIEEINTLRAQVYSAIKGVAEVTKRGEDTYLIKELDFAFSDCLTQIGCDVSDEILKTSAQKHGINKLK